jgi:hypothetical protein
MVRETEDQILEREDKRKKGFQELAGAIIEKGSDNNLVAYLFFVFVFDENSQRSR